MYKMYFYKSYTHRIPLSKFLCGVCYLSNEGMSFNEGGRYFNFHVNWKDVFFYLYLHFFRLIITREKKVKINFKWLGWT